MSIGCDNCLYSQKNMDEDPCNLCCRLPEFPRWEAMKPRVSKAEIIRRVEALEQTLLGLQIDQVAAPSPDKLAASGSHHVITAQEIHDCAKVCTGCAYEGRSYSDGPCYKCTLSPSMWKPRA